MYSLLLLLLLCHVGGLGLPALRHLPICLGLNHICEMHFKSGLLIDTHEYYYMHDRLPEANVFRLT